MLKDAWFLERNKIPDPSIPDSIDTNRRANKRKKKKNESEQNEGKSAKRFMSRLVVIDYFRVSRNVIIINLCIT